MGLAGDVLAFGLSRLAFEPFGSAAAGAVVERWNDARPDHVPALQARLTHHAGTGDHDAAAAKRADLEVLLALQAEKTRILDDMAKDPPPLEVRTDLAVRAGQNLPLLRQLVALHRGLLGGEAPLYGPRGLTPLSPRGTRLAESG